MPRLTWNDKLVIEKMLNQGYKAPAIARKLGVHHSTVYDETSVDRESLGSIMLDEDPCIESEVHSSGPFEMTAMKIVGLCERIHFCKHG